MVCFLSLPVKSEATDSALNEIYYELNNYLNNGIDEDELLFTQNSITNSDALRYETAFQKLGFYQEYNDINLIKNIF